MRLSVKYAATILSLVFAIVIAFAAVILVQFRSEITGLNSSGAEALRQSVLKQIREKETSSVKVLAFSLVNPVYQLDMLKIGELISAVKQQSDVLYVYVFDRDRKILVDGSQGLESYGRSLNDSLTQETMRTGQLATEVASDVFHISTPIKIQDEILGGIRIGYSVKRIFADIAKQEADLTHKYQAVAAKQLSTVGLLAMAFAIGGLIASIFVARNWSNPIRVLAGLTARVGAGDYNVDIPVQRSDEIGDLANAFRRMVANLKSLHQHDLESSESLRLANIKLTETNRELVNEIGERQRAEQKVLQQNGRLQVLSEINSAISSTLDRQVLIETLFDKIDSLLPYSAVTMRLVDNNKLVPVAARNIDTVAWVRGIGENDQIEGKGYSQKVVHSKSPVMIDNVQTDPRCWNQDLFRRHGLLSYIGMPIITNGEVLGVLGFYLKEHHQFDDDEVEFLSTIAGQVAIAVYNARLYEQVKTQAKKLQKANETKDEFLSVMSHELRTPLNVIMGYAQVLSSGIMGEITPEQEKSLKKLMLHADDLLSMINNILQVGKLQSGLVEVEIESMNLTEFLEEMKSSYDLCSKQNVELVWQIPPHSIMVETDKTKLKHIIQNLINNAIKFTDEGNVTVSARSLTETIEIEVSDTGIGIPNDSLETIFEMFRQADSSKTRTHGGTGVGLYIVKKFTETLNGRVHVESVVGKGTRFTLKLPAAAGERFDLPAWDSSMASMTSAWTA